MFSRSGASSLPSFSLSTPSLLACSVCGGQAPRIPPVPTALPSGRGKPLPGLEPSALSKSWRTWGDSPPCPPSLSKGGASSALELLHRAELGGGCCEGPSVPREQVPLFARDTPSFVPQEGVSLAHCDAPSSALVPRASSVDCIARTASLLAHSLGLVASLLDQSYGPYGQRSEQCSTWGFAPSGCFAACCPLFMAEPKIMDVLARIYFQIDKLILRNEK